MNSSDDIFETLGSNSSDPLDFETLGSNSSDPLDSDVLEQLESAISRQGKRKKNKKRMNGAPLKAKEKRNRLVMGCYIRGFGLVLTCLLAWLMRRGEAKLLNPVEYWAFVVAFAFWGLYGVAVIISGFLVSIHKKYLSFAEPLLGGVQIGALCMTVLSHMVVHSHAGDLVQAMNHNQAPTQRCSDSVAVQ